MAKILLVEDDNNLREIYEARLQAEGYDIVSARDGEEALTVAMKERPDLIISDVMMPKISGFDMLDIIRSTEETKNSKVIMMTALSQAEDKERASKLGADRYLVKSQVTLEDVAKVAREVLEDDNPQSKPQTEASDKVPQTSNAPGSTSPAEPIEAAAPQLTTAPIQPAPIEETDTPTVTAAQTDTPVVSPQPTPTVDPVQVAAQSSTPDPSADDSSATVVSSDPPAASPADPAQPVTPAAPVATDDNDKQVEALGQSVKDEEKAIAAQIESFIDSKKSTDSQTAVPTEPAPQSTEDNPPLEPQNSPNPSTETSGKKVIQPISDSNASSGPDLDALLKKEEEKEQMAQIAKELSSNPPQAETPPVETSESNFIETPIPTNPTETPETSAAETPQFTEDLPHPAPAPEEPDENNSSEQTAPKEPIIPHTNGTSVDGVSAAPSTPPAQSPDPNRPDPNSIAL